MLVTHYFKNKDELLRAAIEELTPGPPPFFTELQDKGPNIGTRVALAYLHAWEDPITGPRLRAIARAVTESPAAAELASHALQTVTTAHSSPTADPAGVQLAFSQLLGTAYARYILKIQPLADLPVEHVAATLGIGLDHLLHP